MTIHGCYRQDLPQTPVQQITSLRHSREHAASTATAAHNNYPDLTSKFVSSGVVKTAMIVEAVVIMMLRGMSPLAM